MSQRPKVSKVKSLKDRSLKVFEVGVWSGRLSIMKLNSQCIAMGQNNDKGRLRVARAAKKKPASRRKLPLQLVSGSPLLIL